jgi:S-formylglutathione hydrolase
MKPKKHLLATFSVLLIAALLVACGSPAAVPTATLAPPTATPIPPTPVPPTATPVPPTATPTAPAATQAPPTPTPASKIETTTGTITSQALAGNLLGDPVTRTYSVLLPPSYGTSDKRYPVVYVLHWWTGNNYAMVGPMLAPYMTLLREDKVQEMIFVFPDASNQLRGSMYLSSPTIGDYETYLTQELVDLVDATYRTIPDRNSRGVTGCSMGGDGSIYLALKYPGVFSIAAPASATYDWARDPIMWKEGPKLLMESPPKDIKGFWKLPWQAQALFATAAAAASNPDEPPFYLDMPVALVDGKAEIVPEVFDKIVAADPTHQVDRYLAQPERLRAILLYHGDGDPEAPVELAHSFDRLLSARGIEHEYVEVSAGHCDFYFGPIVQFMSDHLVGATP